MTDEARPQAPIDRVTEALLETDFETVRDALEELHPAETADLIESLPRQQREPVWALLDPEAQAEVLAEVDDVVRAAHMELMGPQELAAITRDVDLDDAVDILQDLPDPVVEEVLEALDAQNAAILRNALQYDERTAGGLMNTDVITIRADVTLETVRRFLRRRGEIPILTNRLMVIDRDNQLVGILRLALLLTEDPDSLVSEHMMTDSPPIPVDMPDTEVAKLFEQRDFISAPVIDPSGRLLGRITIDDIVDVIRDEGDRLVSQMAGLDEDDDVFDDVMASARRRAPWLGINLATALLASWVIGLFEGTLAEVVALAILMPVVASMGGIAGSQTLTVVIRAMALGQISSSNERWLLVKELKVGVVNSLMWAVVVGLVAGFWFGSPLLGCVAASAIVVNLVAAAIAGAGIPLVLKKFRIDPALAASVVLTTVTDVVGFLVFLGLGTLVLLN